MFSFLKKKNPAEFVATKEMMEAAIIKGKRIGLKREEIIEMACLLDKKIAQKKVEKLVDKVLS